MYFINIINIITNILCQDSLPSIIIENLKCRICLNPALTSFCTIDGGSFHQYCIVKYFENSDNPKSLITNEPLENLSLHVNRLGNLLVEHLIKTTNIFDQYISTLDIEQIEIYDLSSMIINIPKMYHLIKSPLIKKHCKLIYLFSLIERGMTLEVLQILDELSLMPLEFKLNLDDISYVKNDKTLLEYACIKKQKMICHKLLNLIQNNVNNHNYQINVENYDTDDNDDCDCDCDCNNDLNNNYDINNDEHDYDEINNKYIKIIGISTLMWACKNKLTKICCRILKLLHNINIERILNYVDDNGNNALLWACINNMPCIGYQILKLINKYPNTIDINHKNISHETAFGWACFNNLSNIVTNMLEMNNIDINHIDNTGNTALIWTCHEGLSSILNLLLTNKKLDINYSNNEGNTALMIACMCRMTDIALILLNYIGIDILIMNKNKQSAFTIACNEKLIDVTLKILECDIDKKLNINYKTQDGQTALMWLCYYEGMENIALKLLEYPNLDINCAEYTTNSTALIIACYNENMINIVNCLLMRKDVNLNHVNTYKITALIMACKMGNIGIAINLLNCYDINNNNININYIDDNGNTALIIACMTGLSNVAIELLTKINIDYTHKNNNNMDALYYSHQLNLVDVIQILSNKT